MPKAEMLVRKLRLSITEWNNYGSTLIERGKWGSVTDPIWEVDPFEVTVEDGLVVLDGRATSPETARALADALRQAAQRAEGI